MTPCALMRRTRSSLMMVQCSMRKRGSSRGGNHFHAADPYPIVSQTGTSPRWQHALDVGLVDKTVDADAEFARFRA